MAKLHISYLHIKFIYAESFGGDMLVFIDADRYITIPRDVYDIAYREDEVPSAPRVQTRGEKIAEIKARLAPAIKKDLIAQYEAVEDKNPVTPVLTTPERKLSEYHPAIQEVERVIGKLDLREPQNSPRLAGILINDEAGPDGQTFTQAQWRSMCDLLMTPMKKGDEHTPSGRDLLSAKRVIFNRMKGLPLYQLMRHVSYTPDVIRHNIVMTQIEAMGHGERGEGTNFIPSAYSAFISGDVDFAEKEAQAMAHAVKIVEQEGPTQEKNVNAEYGTSSMMSLEEQFGALDDVAVKS